MDKDEINENLQQIWNLLRETHTNVSVLSHKVNTHVEEESEWKPQMLQLVETWHQAKGVINFIKWCAVIGAGIASIGAWISQHFTWK